MGQWLVLKYNNSRQNMLSYYQRQRNQRNNTKQGLMVMGSKGSSPSVSPNHEHFHSPKLASKQNIKEESIEKGDYFKSRFKIATTDQSSNNQESESQESQQCLAYKQLNEVYFQPLSFKQKKLKAVTNKKEPQTRLLKDISTKICEMSRLVSNQDKQVSILRSSMSDKELHRLFKMHSIEKFKLIQSIARHHSSKSKKKM